MKLICGDCLCVMRDMTDNSVDAIITDPPYFQIKGGFDWNYKDFNHYLEFIEQCAVEWKRILKKNGSLYVFAHAKRVAYIQVILDKYFNLENNLVWEKIECQTRMGINNFRCFAPITERILFYSREVERIGLGEIKLYTDNFTTLRVYFKQVQEFIGLGEKAKREELGHGGAISCFRFNSNWNMPTDETYAQLIAVFGIDKMEGFRKYESLRLEYESLRRPFNNVHKLTDVIKHSQESHISGQFKHDTIKPLGLITKLIETSTRKGDIVFDPFMGSGTTGIACKNTQREFIGIELDEEYFEMSRQRIDLELLL